MYKALYRKWRPQTFGEVAGQEHITSVLSAQAAAGRVSHAYLFCGTRGTGKTTSAKILAKAVNCENPSEGNPCNECHACVSIDNGSATDVLEIDAASNNRVADVRELIDEVVYPPTTLKKRVYIVDEVHMLSDSAFNALLKTLEEPPEYVLFILATTELNQLPSTIVSRCMRFDFKRAESAVIAERVNTVAAGEGIPITGEATSLISALADGSFRDALSLLDACAAGAEGGEITGDYVRDRLGIAGSDSVLALFEAILDKDIAKALGVVGEIYRSSKDLGVFISDTAAFAVELLITGSQGHSGAGGRLSLSGAEPRVEKLAKSFDRSVLLYFCSVLENAIGAAGKFSADRRTVFELAVIRMCDPSLSDSPEALAARISALERKAAVALPAQREDKSPEPAAEDSDKPKPAKKAKKQDKPAEREHPRVFGSKAELTELLKDNPEINSFVALSEIFDNGRELIIYTSAIGADMLSGEGSKKIIADAARAVCGSDRIIVLSDKKPEKTAEDPLDEIESII